VRHRANVGDLSHSLLSEVLTVRVHLGIGRPVDARHHLERAFDVLVALDGVMPHELHDPPPAPAGERSS